MKYKLSLLLVGLILITVGLKMGADTGYTVLNRTIEINPPDHSAVRRLPLETPSEPDGPTDVISPPQTNPPEPDNQDYTRAVFSATPSLKLISLIGQVNVIPSRTSDILIEYTHADTSPWRQELVPTTSSHQTVLELKSNQTTINLDQPVILWLHLPATVEELIIEHNSGSLEVFDMGPMQADLSLDSGNISLTRVDLNGQIDLAMGNLALNDARLNDSQVKLDMGSVSGRARFRGDNAISVNSGDVSLELLQPADEIALDVSVQLGEIYSIPGATDAAVRDRLSVQVQMGEINLTAE